MDFVPDESAVNTELIEVRSGSLGLLPNAASTARQCPHDTESASRPTDRQSFSRAVVVAGSGFCSATMWHLVLGLLA